MYKKLAAALLFLLAALKAHASNEIPAVTCTPHPIEIDILAFKKLITRALESSSNYKKIPESGLQISYMAYEDALRLYSCIYKDIKSDCEKVKTALAKYSEAGKFDSNSDTSDEAVLMRFIHNRVIAAQ